MIPFPLFLFLKRLMLESIELPRFLEKGCILWIGGFILHLLFWGFSFLIPTLIALPDVLSFEWISFSFGEKMYKRIRISDKKKKKKKGELECRSLLYSVWGRDCWKFIKLLQDYKIIKIWSKLTNVFVYIYYKLRRIQVGDF